MRITITSKITAILEFEDADDARFELGGEDSNDTLEQLAIAAVEAELHEALRTIGTTSTTKAIESQATCEE